MDCLFETKMHTGDTKSLILIASQTSILGFNSTNIHCQSPV